MNKMTEKLIEDGKEVKKARFNMISSLAGAFMALLGIILIFIKANSVEYIDQAGILHENFYLLPLGFALILGGLGVILTTGIYYLLKKKS